MIKIAENAEEKKDNSLKLNVNDTICCWNNNVVQLMKTTS